MLRPDLAVRHSLPSRPVLANETAGELPPEDLLGVEVVA